MQRDVLPDVVVAYHGRHLDILSPPGLQHPVPGRHTDLDAGLAGAGVESDAGLVDLTGVDALEVLVAEADDDHDLPPGTVLVVDDGSTDGTGDLATKEAKEWGALRILRHRVNLGKTEALVTAAEAQPDSLVAALDTPDGWHQLDAIRVETRQLMELLGGPLSQVLDLPIGFNSYDGD